MLLPVSGIEAAPQECPFFAQGCRCSVTGIPANPFYSIDHSVTERDVTQFMDCQAYIPAYNPDDFPHLYKGHRVGDEQQLGDSGAVRNRGAAAGQPSRGRNRGAATGPPSRGRNRGAANRQSSRGRNRRATIEQSSRMNSHPDGGSSSFLGESTKVPSAHAGTEAVAKPPSLDKSTELAPALADAEVFEKPPVHSDLQSSGSPPARPWANLVRYQFQALQVPTSYQGSVKRRHAQIEPSEDPPLANPSDENPARQVPTSYQGSAKRRRVREEASKDPVSLPPVGPSGYQYPAGQVPTSHRGSAKKRRVREEASVDPVFPPSVSPSAYQYPALQVPTSGQSSPRRRAAVGEDPVFPPPVSPSTYRGPAGQVPTPHRASSKRPAARSEGSKSRVPDHEQLLIKQLVQEQMDLNNYTEDKWKNISEALKTRYDVDRNFMSVKNFWSRYGRGKFGLDERKIKNPAKMITSTQTPADRKRAREEKKVSGEAAKRQKVSKPKDEDDGTNTAVEGYGYEGSGTVTDSFEQAGGSGLITHPFEQAGGSTPVTHPFEQAEGSGTITDHIELSGGSGPITHPLEQTGGSGTVTDPFELAGGSGTIADPFQQAGGSGTIRDPFNLGTAQRQNETEPEDDNDGTIADAEVYGYGGRDTTTHSSQQAGGSEAVTHPYQQAVANPSGQAARNPLRGLLQTTLGIL